MKILVDVNLTMDWVRYFAQEGIEARHWTEVGDPRAEDALIMLWARKAGFVVFTNDLDFGTMLALAGDTGPSIFQIRTQEVLPVAIGSNVLALLRAHADSLDKGAVIVVDERGGRVRSLPIRTRS